MNPIGLLATWPGRIGAVVLVAAIAGGGIFVARGNTATPQAALRTATVTRGSVSQTVSVSGSLNALGQARLAFKTGGKLSTVYVTTGQAVTAGQPLAKLDTTDLETALATADQSLANAQASYQKALLSASDTQRSLQDAQRTAANDVATAQATLAKLKSNYATAKTNYTVLSNGGINDLGAYRTGFDAIRTQLQLVLNDLNGWATSDANSARNSINSADAAMANAQTYSLGLLAFAMADYSTSRDAINAAVTLFDNAVDGGGDTSGAQAAYQTAQLNYNVAQSRLLSAIDTVSAQVTTAQTAVNAAVASLSSLVSRPQIAFDPARGDLNIAQQAFTSQGTILAASKVKLAQAATPMNTLTDALNGSIVNAITAIGTAQDRGASSIRSAQSAVANIPFNLQSAQVGVDNANNSVSTAKTNLDNAVLTAPAAGIVASIANQVGEFVTGGNTNSAFIVLTNNTTMVLHGTIGESDVAKLKLGQVANITVDALSGQRMTGRVTSLDPVATIAQGVPVYGIDIAIDVPGQGVKAGMTANGSVILASKQNVLTVPNTTVRTINGQRGVQVLKDGEIVDTVATFGLANDTVTEVLTGLAEGDVIVIPQAKATTATARPGGGGVQIPGAGGGVRGGG
ncbi:MAG: biotin/lipoyl-binding protein [Chloroflexota bacterium]|nr:biotin/lipoyl-binding protein [Chloroflexota bacterium]